MAKDLEIDGLRALLKARQPAPGAPPPSREDARAAADAWGLSVPLPEGCVVEEITVGGVPCELVTPKGAATDKVILYLHGGGYVGGSPRSHRQLGAKLAEAAGTVALSVDYRLAPEHPFPAAVEDALSAYRWLLDKGFEGSRIIISGDSAGGGLTVAVTHALRAAGLPQPAGLYPISPWADLTQSGAAYAAVGERDPMITKAGLDMMAGFYLAGQDAAHPHASPVTGAFAGFPPMLIHVGSEEQLLSDSTLLAERAGVAGVEVRLEIWPEMIHVWPVFNSYLGAGKRAIEVAGAWMREKLA